MYRYLLWSVLVLALLASPNLVRAEHYAPTASGIPPGEGVAAPIYLRSGGGLGGRSINARFEVHHLPPAFHRLVGVGDLFRGIVHPLPSGPNTRFTLQHPGGDQAWAHGSLQGRPGPLSLDPRYRLTLPHSAGAARVSGPGLQRTLASGEIVELDGWCLMTWVEAIARERTVSWLAWRPSSDTKRCHG